MTQTVDVKTQHLVMLAQGGDEAALNQLCRIYGARVLWLVRLRMGKELRAKLESVDLVQDVLMSALRDIGTFTYKDEGDFLRWLARITENRLRDQIEKLHAQKRDIRKEVPCDGRDLSGDDGPTLNWQPITVTTPSAIISRQEEYEKLQSALDALKPEYRDVIVLAKIDGLSHKEVGDKLGKSSDAVRMLLARAMTVLTSTFECD
jgi:RNA polymerase sigma-70 factor (ECF subfamily)